MSFSFLFLIIPDFNALKQRSGSATQHDEKAPLTGSKGLHKS
jgi:hypothetical protein